MRDRWLEDHVGSEAFVRPEFEASLGETLQSAWRQPGVPTVAPSAPGPSRRTHVFIWASAAAVLLIGGAIVVTQTGKSTVTSSTSDVTVPETTAVVPDTTTVERTAATTVPPDTAATTPVPPTTLPPVVVAATTEQQTVLDYLSFLSEQKYEDAAKLLGEGGLSWGDRSDLRPFLNAEGQIPSLAESLKAWCESALCQLPTGLSGDSYQVTATFAIDGVERSAMFVGATFEGSPLVYGLPLQLPAGTSLADTVQCPLEQIDDTAYADLNGDGWFETLTLAEGLSGDNTLISVCGSSLDIPVLAVPVSPDFIPPTRVLVLDIEGDGSDELLLTSFDPDGFSGPIARYSEGMLIATGQTVSLAPIRGESFGCVDLDGDGVRDLVNYSYSFVGGTDISNSTSLDYTASRQVGDMTVSGSLPLPAQADEAFRLTAGYCGNLPTQTG